jgi:PadR family transcriptional regulator PadR
MNILSRSEEIVLLAIWKLKGNAYGVTIRELVSRDTGHDWTFGAIYKPLKKLAHKGYVEKSSSGPSTERGGRAKFMYTLTRDGKEALREIRRIHESLWTEECELSFK